MHLLETWQSRTYLMTGCCCLCLMTFTYSNGVAQYLSMQPLPARIPVKCLSACICTRFHLHLLLSECQCIFNTRYHRLSRKVKQFWIYHGYGHVMSLPLGPRSRAYGTCNKCLLKSGNIYKRAFKNDNTPRAADGTPPATLYMQARNLDTSFTYKVH